MFRNEVLRGALGKFAEPLPWSDHQVVAPPDRSHVVSMGVEQAERMPHVCYVAQPDDGEYEITKAIRREVVPRIRRERDTIAHPRGPIADDELVFDPFEVVIDVTAACTIVNHDRTWADIDATGSESVTFTASLTGMQTINNRRFATYHIEQE